MKRLIISVIMAALALFVAVFSYFDVSSNAVKMEKSLTAAVEELENGDAASAGKSCDDAVKIWKRCKPRFEMYLYSGELFEIDLNFSKIKKLSETDENGELKELLLENISLIKRLADNQSPTPEKVF